MPSPIRATAILVVVVAMSGTSCARNAPPLPSSDRPVRTLDSFAANDRGLTCKTIDDQLRALKDETESHEGVVRNDRGYNQAVGYFAAVFFWPAVVLTNANAAQKDALDKIQERWDELIDLKRVKSCPRNHSL